MNRSLTKFCFLALSSLAMMLSIILCNSCSKADSGVQIKPQAEFSYLNTKLLVGEPVQFANESLNTNESTTFYWEFGDGNTSLEETPTHVYDELGKYMVSLTVTNNGIEPVRKSLEIMVCLSNTIPGRTGLRSRLNNLDSKIMVCAHRANHYTTPENSIAALEASISEGIAFAEIDIKQSKDGKLVLMHDNTIDRTTSGSGGVNEYTFDELKQFNLEHNGNLTSQQIPSFAEILEAARGKIYLDLDVKIENFIKVYNEVKLYGMVDQVMFTVDNISTAKSLVDNDERVIVMPIINNQQDIQKYNMAGLNLAVLHYTSSSFNNELITVAHNKNLQVFRLVYVNSNTTPESDSYRQMDKFVELKGNIVQTDYPVEVKAFLQSNNVN
ncbi:MULTISPECIES: glycerophosphodiester phosphodiesterase family protein [unclassified Carboxylicivirga]|uniref:glycerophosphodiester phosphodiesterase family protein n=1 Tax=Carboxylicivirga TaxID=1628153 RepID=UPI003D328307